MMVAPLGKHVLNNGHTPRNDWYKCQGPEADPSAENLLELTTPHVLPEQGQAD
jgi:hypothetical protein